MIMWSGFSYANTEQGPPGCEEGDDSDHCTALSVFDGKENGPKCFETPTVSPLPEDEAKRRSWVCEHRWAGVAGLVNFRKACRQFPVSKVWRPANVSGVSTGRLAFRLGSECFVALVRAPFGDWELTDLDTGLPEGRYCDMASLPTQRG